MPCVTLEDDIIANIVQSCVRVRIGIPILSSVVLRSRDPPLPIVIRTALILYFVKVYDSTIVSNTYYTHHL